MATGNVLPVWTFLYRAGWGLARTVAPLLSAGDGKLARAMRGRRDAAGAIAEWASRRRDRTRPLVWFHAASVGEGRQAEAVLAPLRRARPGWQIVFTYASSSAERLAGSIGADYAGYLPADTPRDTALALDALAPSALVFSATDLWPELVREATARHVRVGLISATLAPTSSRRGAFARALLGGAYRALDAVGAIDETDADALVRLGVQRDVIRITGDTRHDAAAQRAAAIDRSAPHLAAIARSDVPVLVAGSTWPSDERVLFPALAEVRRRTPVATVIAPHEPDASHLTDLEQHIRRLWPDARVARLSVLEADVLEPTRASRHSPRPYDFCLVDRLGVLADLYATAAVAYVGGGFHSAGLHAVIEPAALGVPVLFGPRWQSSRDARLLLDRGGGASAADAGTLADALGRWLEDTTARAAAGAAARAVVDSGRGAAERSLELVLGLVENQR